MSLIRKHVAVLQAWACLALVIFIVMWRCLQRITCTFNSQEQKRLLMDLDVNMRTGSCPYAVQFYGALFREVIVSSV